MDSNLHHSINCYSPYLTLVVLSRVGNEAKSEVYEVGAAGCLDMALRPCHDYVWWANFSCTLERDFFSCGNSFNLLAHVEKIRVSVARLSIGGVLTLTPCTPQSTKKKKEFLTQSLKLNVNLIPKTNSYQQKVNLNGFPTLSLV